MDTHEWCAIAHIDFRPSSADRGAVPQAGKGSSFEEGEQVLRVLAAAEHPPGTVDLAVLQQLYAANRSPTHPGGCRRQGRSTRSSRFRRCR
jgi:hypothetical protein